MPEDAAHSPTEGNPLFVTEVVRLVKQERFGEDSNWEMRVPEGIKDAISGRLSGLTKRCNQSLTTASIMGREFRHQHLTRIVGDSSVGSKRYHSKDALLRVLEEASAAFVAE